MTDEEADWKCSLASVAYIVIKTNRRDPEALADQSPAYDGRGGDSDAVS